MEEFIVAEISKNWDNTKSVEPSSLISQKFAALINVNNDRGYDLVDWRINTFIHDEILNETIIAIFKKKE